MLKIIGNELGMLVAKRLLKIEKVENNLAGLERLLNLFFSELERILPKDHSNFKFSSQLDATVLCEWLKTSSKCQIYKYYPIWCEEGCIEFIESFAKTLDENIEVKRVARQPNDDVCKFEFSY
jgi:hypothetical protein